MANKMLIDASHPEETRVAVIKGNRIEEFDFESQHRKQLKGNIYLARVTRVEPSLQAAFVEYGGNRHGFLAFSEIHPDYYQIPVADRQALLAAEAEAAREEVADDDAEAEKAGRKGRGRKRRGHRRGGSEDQAAADTDAALSPAPEPVNMEHLLSDEDREALAALNVAGNDETDETNGEDDDVESVGAEDALEEVPNRRRITRRNYKIQEVVKRRQILLVQIVKEERGNKGAALTTYLSLAGRYSVLMPNTARGGGISRKITNAQDRRRLKDVVKELNVPQGMGVILRTAGANRTKPEIKRDYEYLMRLWENVRNLTLESIAPTLVYEEGSLIKRSVRDLYNKDTGEILVSGDDGYREAKDFMRMLMPSHAKAVQPYREATPLFARYGIEGQLDRMLQPQMTLKSGGYIIINQTEALVAIDVNSGRSTREHSIEDTAYQTNLEAADEVARQLRLRDLAGLIVIDFIDMEEKRNNRNVEKRLKEALKHDRARIQVGRISHFGLLEMSRQRIRASVLESTMSLCHHCNGTGYIRSESSIALHVMRTIEEYLISDSRNNITVKTPTATALYVLNHKRQMLAELEERFGLVITIEADEEVGGQHVVITKGSAAPDPGKGFDPGTLAVEDDDEEDEAVVEAESTDEDEDNGEGKGKRRKRRRRRRGRDRDGEDRSAETEQAADSADDTAEDGDKDEAGDDDSERKRRRRGRRGGRRNRRDAASRDSREDGAEDRDESTADAAPAEPAVEDEGKSAEAAGDDDSRPKRGRRRRKSAETEAAVTGSQPEPVAVEAEQPARADTDAEVTQAAEPSETGEKPDDKPERRSTRRGKSSGDGKKEPVPSKPVVTSTVQSGNDEEAPAPRKAGWWQRKSFF